MHSSTFPDLPRRALCMFGALSLVGAASAQVGAKPALDGWPTRPLRLIVGSGGGSSTDHVARTLADPLSRALGQPVIVENHPGASGNIAASMVARASDRHTVGLLITGNMTIAKLLNPATQYDPHKDLGPVSLISTAPLVLAARADAAGTDSRMFFEAARSAGSRWSYGSPGIGTISHLGMEILKSQSGIAPVHVPYLSNPEVINAMIAGHLQLALLPPGLAEAQIRAGKLRAIGVSSVARSPLVPDYPTLADAGVKGFQLEIWTAAAAPATLPRPIVDRLSTLFAEITRSPEVSQKLFQYGYQAVGSTSDELASRVKGDTALLSRIIAEQGLKFE